MFYIFDPFLFFADTVGGICEVADFGNIELREGNFLSRLANGQTQCQVYSCEVRGKYTDVNTYTYRSNLCNSVQNREYLAAWAQCYRFINQPCRHFDVSRTLCHIRDYALTWLGHRPLTKIASYFVDPLPFHYIIIV